MSTVQVRNKDLLYPELSYKIIGSAFEVYNELGHGHVEKVYQKALAEVFKTKDIAFKEQVYSPVTFRDKIVGKFFMDFLVEESIVVELKKDDKFSKSHIDQVLNYLKIQNLKLAILINFAKEGVIHRRIINFDN